MSRWMTVRIAFGWCGYVKNRKYAVSLIQSGSTYTAELERLHLWGNDEEIDREFNAVCQTIGATHSTTSIDDCLAKEDHDWLDACASGLLLAASSNFQTGYRKRRMTSIGLARIPRRRHFTSSQP
jgi:hypothetical protein